MNRILIFGNSGAGKTTLAREIARSGIPHLDLDTLAWDPGPTRRPLSRALAEIERFLAASDSWVVEGSYGDLVEHVLPRCNELVFLNPGVDACVAHCLARPWEPEKYESPDEQNARLDFLLQWVRQYATREDEFSLARHRRIFDRFPGSKVEITGEVRDFRAWSRAAVDPHS